MKTSSPASSVIAHREQHNKNRQMVFKNRSYRGFVRFHSNQKVSKPFSHSTRLARDQHQPCLREVRMAFCFESHVVPHHSEVCGMHHLQEAKTTPPRAPKLDEILCTLIGHISYSGHLESFTTTLLGLCFKRKYPIFISIMNHELCAFVHIYI